MAKAKPKGTKEERVGVLLVHGIGEQRRFEHLEAEARNIALALQAANEANEANESNVQVVVNNRSSAPYSAEQEVWEADARAPVQILLLEGDPRVIKTRIEFREVWWADLDEPTGFWVQLKFWAWGLSLWAIDPSRFKPQGGQKQLMQPPGKKLGIGLWGRFRLLFVGGVFLLLLVSLSIPRRIWTAATRFLPGSGILPAYIGDIKLYTQDKRVGKGPLLDMGQAPRRSIRRRMMRGLMDMALEDYDRWYVLAHSLGTVVAFNGLMEHGLSFARYMDEQRWEDSGKFIGTVPANQPAQKSVDDPAQGIDEPPALPPWVGTRDYINREALYKKLEGFLTYGSPLDKFAALWPKIVMRNLDLSCFNKKFEWINVYDPADPVADHLDYFPLVDEKKINKSPRNICYITKWPHLLAHTKYLAANRNSLNRLVNKISDWLAHGVPFPQSAGISGRWPSPGGIGAGSYAVPFRYGGWIFIAGFAGYICSLWMPALIDSLFGSAPECCASCPEPCVDEFEPSWEKFLSWIEQIFVDVLEFDYSWGNFKFRLLAILPWLGKTGINISIYVAGAMGIAFAAGIIKHIRLLLFR